MTLCQSMVTGNAKQHKAQVRFRWWMGYSHVLSVNGFAWWWHPETPKTEKKTKKNVMWKLLEWTNKLWEFIQTLGNHNSSRHSILHVDCHGFVFVSFVTISNTQSKQAHSCKKKKKVGGSHTHTHTHIHTPQKTS